MMNSKDMTTDELLSAYIDGELDRDTANAVTARLAAEPELMQRLEKLRGADEAIRRLLGSVDKLPMPDSVTQMIEAADATDNVVELRPRRRPTFLQMPVAIAASLALVAGFLANDFLRGTAPTGPGIEALSTGTIAADTSLHALLDEAPSGAPQAVAEGTSATLILSFQDRAGDFCRQLRIDSAAASTHAVACRRNDAWQLEAMAFASPGSGQYQQAGSDTPAVVDSAVTALLGNGQILSDEEENAFISEGWKKTNN